MGAQGSQSGLAIREEAIWGVLDAGQFTGTNFVSEDMKFDIENKASNNIRPDRQTVDLVQVGAETNGGFETEMQATNLDLVLPGFLWAEDWTFVNGSDNTGITAGATASNLDFTITASTKRLTFGSSITHAIEAGAFISLAGFTNTGNNGVFLVSAVDGQNITLVGTTFVDETAQSTATCKGGFLKNGIYRHSYSIERSNNDIAQFFLYLGMVGNTMEVTLESGEPAMVNLQFVGKDEQLAQTQWGTTDPTAPPTSAIMNAVSSVGQILVDGTVVGACLLQKVGFTIDNQVEGKTGVGTLGFCDAAGKSLSLTGELALYFNDETHYTKYKNSTAFSLAIQLADTAGNVYGFMLPECKYDEATANVTGKDDDVLMEAKFVGIMDPTDLYTVCVSRILA
jgi:hypothetical protein